MKRILRILRIGAAIVAVFVVAIAVAFPMIVQRIGGASSKKAEEMQTGLSGRAKALIARANEGIDPARRLDVHTHLVGLGIGGTGAWVNPNWTSILHPRPWISFKVYASAASITDLEDADRQYVARLVSLVRGMGPHGRYTILAFDRNYRDDGTVNLEASEFYTPNEYAERIAAEYPDIFVPAMSVHPYRADALVELERAAKSGARFVKWLPNAMGIDPEDKRLDPFYAKMRELDLILLTHAGEEKAVHAEDAQKLGNPRRLRHPLDLGVRVVVAHCASLGEEHELGVDNFDLFLDLMSEKKYDGLVFGELSAITIATRLWRPLKTMLARTDLHPRLVDGSDYPLPAINALVHTEPFVDAGMITPEERAALDEIYDYNPLLFDFVLKRTLRHPESGARFAAEIFMENAGLARRAR